WRCKSASDSWPPPPLAMPRPRTRSRGPSCWRCSSERQERQGRRHRSWKTSGRTSPLCERGPVGYTSSMRHAPLLLVALSLLACETKSSATKLDAKPTEAKSEAQPAEAKTAEPSTKPAEHQQPTGPIIEHTVKLLDGTDKSLADYRGKTLLVVNTASECGFTPQYAELQKLYADYKDKGLEVLAFPSNDFGEQEPGTPEQI